jgi:hypothetical protein
MAIANVLTILLLSSAAAEILNQPTFTNPFTAAEPKYSSDSLEVTSSVPYREAKGLDRGFVEHLLPYILTIRDIDAERANLENSFASKKTFDDEEYQLTTDALI